MDKSSVIIIMLTTSLNPKDVEKAEEADINGFLNKPLTEQDLKEVWKKHFTS